MFPDPLLCVPDAIPHMVLTVLPALLAGPGAVAIVVAGAIAIAAGAALLRKARGGPGSRTIATSAPAARPVPSRGV
jgi:hypothetical protein